jgi:hypothetical protein
MYSMKRTMMPVPLDHGVDLDRSETRIGGRADTLEHAVALGETPAHLSKDLGIERVEADRDA